MNVHEITVVLDGALSMCISAFTTIFGFLTTTFYSYHGFRLSLFDFALSLMVLDAACLLIFPWYSSDDENE